jgi:hypothetical protein
MHKLWEDEQLEKICSWERLVQATYRAWSARQGVNGTPPGTGAGVSRPKRDAFTLLRAPYTQISCPPHLRP